jgi:hypothetical protein
MLALLKKKEQMQEFLHQFHSPTTRIADSKRTVVVRRGGHATKKPMSASRLAESIPSALLRYGSARALGVQPHGPWPHACPAQGPAQVAVLLPSRELPQLTGPVPA